MPVSKLISDVFYCFMNFLCISLFFRPFVFVVFFSEICGRHFLKHNNAKNKLISAIESTNKHIYMNFVKKTQFALILYTKSHFRAIFGPTCMYKKLRKFRTVIIIIIKRSYIAHNT